LKEENGKKQNFPKFTLKSFVHLPMIISVINFPNTQLEVFMKKGGGGL
jgi:hypothetical protein